MGINGLIYINLVGLGYYRPSIISIIVTTGGYLKGNRLYKTSKTIYYGPSVISVTVTKGGYPRGSRHYKTSKTMGRGVAKSYNYIYTKRTYILTYLRIKRTDIPTYLTITIGRSYIFKHIVPTIR